MYGLKKLDIGLFSFIILFPGYFIYNSMVGMGIMYGVLRGYWTFVSILLLPILLISYKNKIYRNDAYLKFDVYFVSFIIFFIFNILLSFIFSSNKSRFEIGFVHLSLIPQLMAVFLSTRLLNLDWSNRYCKILLSMFIVLSLMVFYNSSNNSFGLGSLKDLSLSDSGKTASYQGYGLAYLMTSSLLLNYMRKFSQILIVLLISVICLFIIGARSESVAFMLLTIVIFFFRSNQRMLMLLIFSFILLVMYFFSDSFMIIIMDNFHNSRLLSLFEISQDRSILERTEMLHFAFETIFNNPIFGSYASYEPGHYAHNIFSAWVDLGLFGFLLYCVLLFMPFLNLIINYNYSSRISSYQFVLGIVILVLFLDLFSKPFTNLYLPYMVALFASYVNLHIKIRLGDKLTSYNRI